MNNNHFWEVEIFPNFISLKHDGEPWGNATYKTATAALTAIARVEGKYTEDRNFSVTIRVPFPDEMLPDHSHAMNTINRKLQQGKI